MLKSKLHGATVTDKNLEYMGSITIDAALIEEAELLVGEQVYVLNLNNGARFQTYVIEGERGSGEICINGAAARLCEVGDRVLILSFVIVDEEEAKKLKPKIVMLDEKNQVKEIV